MTSFNYTELVCTAIAVVSIVSALLVVAQAVNNPVNAVLWLIVSFVAVACYLITAGMTFLGLSYIIVYVGAIAVLFLFVVMMLNLANQNDQVTPSITKGGQTRVVGLSRNKIWPVAILIILTGALSVLPLSLHITPVVDIPIAVLDLVHSIMYGNDNNLSQSVFNVSAPSPMGLGSELSWYGSVAPHISPMNQVQMLGLTLYTHGALWLIIISILLMLAMLVPLALAFTS